MQKGLLLRTRATSSFSIKKDFSSRAKLEASKIKDKKNYFIERYRVVILLQGTQVSHEVGLELPSML